MSVVIAYARGWVKGFTLPLASGIGEDIGAEGVDSIVKRFREFIGEDLARKLNSAFNEAMKDEVGKALSTDRLEYELHSLVERFWARISLPLVELTQSILSRMDRLTLNKFLALEEELGISMAKIIKNSSYRFADELVYGLSVLIDRDRWVIVKASEIGIDAFVNRVVDRDPKALIEFASYTMYLAFTWLASTAAVLGIVKKYREENRDTLAYWCRMYAKEVENYIDTLDILVNDEVYEELVELGIIKR